MIFCWIPKKGKDATKPELNALEQGALTFYVDIMASYKRYLKDDKFNTEEFVNHNAQTKQVIDGVSLTLDTQPGVIDKV